MATSAEKAAQFYNSSDSDKFYSIVWGADQGYIHIGIYDSPDDGIVKASERTIARFTELVSLNASSKVLDLGSGIGGTSRYLSRNFGCHVTGLNISELENEQNIAANIKEGLQDKVDVKYGNFENIPFEDNSFDVVLSQDSILHADDKEKVVQEASRVLKKGGVFIFTDYLALENSTNQDIQPILERLHLSSIASTTLYRQYGEKAGLSFVTFEDLQSQIVTHYNKVADKVKEKRQELLDAGVSKEFVEYTEKGLIAWIEAGGTSKLGWGIHKFQKQ